MIKNKLSGCKEVKNEPFHLHPNPHLGNKLNALSKVADSTLVCQVFIVTGFLF